MSDHTGPQRGYLDGLEGYEPSTSWGGTPDSRVAIWAEQRERYGFDERQTWSLDTAMAELLYERLRMYLELGEHTIDLEQHTVDFEDVTLTQREAIERLIELGETFLSPGTDPLASQSAASRFWMLWSALHPIMWW